MGKWRIVNWTNQLAIHQSALTRAMCEMGWEVTIVAEESISTDRLALGWQVPKFGDARIILTPSFQSVVDLLSNEPRNTIHLFGAALQYPWGRYALFRASLLNLKMGLMSEASDPDGWKAPFRWIKHTTRRILFGHKMHFVLAMGNLGVKWFRACGYPSSKIFPFIYVTEHCLDEIVEHRYQLFTVLYVGQLIPRKRVDMLIRAFATLPEKSAQLIIVGDGPERERLQSLSIKLGIQRQISWRGAVPYTQVHAWMSCADLLVLPSRFDGWGAVINEGLSYGTPAICTDRCGVADLLSKSWRGEVVPRNDEAALARALKERLEMGRVNNELRRRIQNWAKCISGQSVAQYLRAIFDYIYSGDERPMPPWLLL